MDKLTNDCLIYLMEYRRSRNSKLHTWLNPKCIKCKIEDELLERLKATSPNTR